MKKVFLGILLVASLIMSGCDQRNKYGECIGILDTPDPNLLYEYDYGNIFIGALFSETIIVPVIVITDCYKCPYGAKNIDSGNKK